jgi:hypothetical protein
MISVRFMRSVLMGIIEADNADFVIISQKL